MYYMIEQSMSDEAILGELARRLRQARLDRNWTQQELAHRTGLSRRTLQKAEESGHMTLLTLIAILRGLDLLGQLDTFLPDAPWSPIQLAQLQGRTRQRASHPRSRTGSSEQQESGWKWKE